jgi:hypothetical protein
MRGLPWLQLPYSLFSSLSCEHRHRCSELFLIHNARFRYRAVVAFHRDIDRGSQIRPKQKFMNKPAGMRAVNRTASDSPGWAVCAQRQGG